MNNHWDMIYTEYKQVPSITLQSKEHYQKESDLSNCFFVFIIERMRLNDLSNYFFLFIKLL